jgi:TolC family type I secretion outer membrane protein
MYSTTLPFFYALSLMLSTGLGVISEGVAEEITGKAPVFSDEQTASTNQNQNNIPKGIEPLKVESMPLASENSSSVDNSPQPQNSPSPIAGPVEPQQPTSTRSEKKEVARTSLGEPVKKTQTKQIQAQTVPDKNIDTLDKALIAAYLSNPQIQEQRQIVRAADERVAQARAGWRPRITGNATIGVDKQVFSGDSVKKARSLPGSSGLEGVRTYSRSVGVNLEQNLFNGGATVYATQSAEAAVKAARAALYDTEQQVLLAAVKAYLDLIAKEAEVEFLISNEDVLKKTLDATRDKFNVGEETRTSVAQAEGEYALAIARRKTAEAELEGIRATFIRVIGRQPGKLVMPPEPAILPATLQMAIEKARLENPTIIKAQFDEVSARREIDRVNSGLLPKLDLTGSSTAGRNKIKRDPTNKSPGELLRPTDDTVEHRVQLGLTIPIYEQGLVRAQKREAMEAAEQRRIAIETARRQVEEGLVTAWEAYQKAKVNIINYETQVKAREVSVEGTRQEMQVGSKILLDVLEELRRLIDAQLQLVQARQRYYYNAYVVRQFMGMLTAQALNLNVSIYDPEPHYQDTRYRFW